MPNTNDHGQTFGEWLMAQKMADGALGELVTVAMADPKFPRRGSLDDVRKRVNEMQADGDTHSAVDDAGADWRSS